MLAGPDFHAVQVRPRRLKMISLTRRTCRAGHAGDAGEGPQWDGYVDMPQVVFRRAPDGEVCSRCAGSGTGMDFCRLNTGR